MTKPKTVTVKFLDRHDKRWSTFEAELTPTPGLVIHLGIGDAGLWTVTHQRSGKLILRVPSRKKARDIAKALNGVADWTKPRAELLKCKSAQATVERLRAEAWA